MFEKELEEYKNQPKWKGKIFMKDEEICFKDGLEFGYNKFREELNQTGLVLQSDMDKTIKQNIALKKELNNVKEWHYAKDELPPLNTNVLVIHKWIAGSLVKD